MNKEQFKTVMEETLSNKVSVEDLVSNFDIKMLNKLWEQFPADRIRELVEKGLSTYSDTLIMVDDAEKAKSLLDNYFTKLMKLDLYTSGISKYVEDICSEILSTDIFVLFEEVYENEKETFEYKDVKNKLISDFSEKLDICVNFTTKLHEKLMSDKTSILNVLSDETVTAFEELKNYEQFEVLGVTSITFTLPILRINLGTFEVFKLAGNLMNFKILVMQYASRDIISPIEAVSLLVAYKPEPELTPEMFQKMMAGLGVN